MVNLSEAEKILSKKKKSVVVKQTISCDTITPVQALLKVKQHFNDYHFLYESVEKGSNKSRYSFIGLMPDLIFKSNGNEVFINRNASSDINDFVKEDELGSIDSLRNLINESKIDGDDDFLSSGIFGYMSYDMVRLMEDIGNGNLLDEINIPDSIFIRPQILVVFDSLFDVATVHAPIYYSEDISVKSAIEVARFNMDKVIDVIINENLSKSSSKEKVDYKFSYSSTQDEYCNMVEKSKQYIKDGDIFQVLPSLRAVTDFKNEDGFSLYRSLRSINPSPFLFYLKFPDFSFMGSSPEIMVSLKGNKVTVRPLAGTRKRGKTDIEDKEIAAELLSDAKELAEHLMLIDLGRHDVGRVSKDGTVAVTQKMIIEYYSHVMHISSNVEGIIKDNLDALDALISGFPAGTVSGAPKIRAMEIIEELEKFKRSFYAGCVGYFASNGDMETCIALRSALVKNNKLYLQAGAGVVHDSVPKMEYKECQNKLAALVAAVENSYNF